MAIRKQKKKEHEKVYELQDTGAIFIGICVTFFVILFMLSRWIPLRIGGLSGGGFFYNTFFVISLFYALLPIVVEDSVSSLIRKRMSKDLYANARRALYAGFIAAIFYTIISLILFVALKDLIFNKILLNGKNSLALFLYFPSIVFTSLTGVIKGFFDSQGMKKKLALFRAITYFVQCICMVIFALAFRGNGMKVAAVLEHKDYAYAYIASGIALGCSISSVIGFLLHLTVFLKAKNKFYRAARKDKSRGVEDVSALLLVLIKKHMPMALSIFSFIFILVLNQIQYGSSLKKTGLLAMHSYTSGIYGGILMITLSVPVLLIWLYLKYCKRDFKKCFSSMDRMESIHVLHRILKTNIMIACFFAALFLATAGILDEVLLGYHSAMTSRMIRFCSIYVILIGYGITMLRGLYYTKSMRHMSWIIPLFTAGLHFVLNIIFLASGTMGIYGIILADIISLLVLCIFASFSMTSAIRFQLDLSNHIIFPAITMAIAGIVMFLLQLVLGFPFKQVPGINYVITCVAGFLAYFVALILTKAVRSEELFNVPGGLLLHNLGSLLRLF